MLDITDGDCKCLLAIYNVDHLSQMANCKSLFHSEAIYTLIGHAFFTKMLIFVLIFFQYEIKFLINSGDDH